MFLVSKYWRRTAWLVILILLMSTGMAQAADRLEDPENDWGIWRKSPKGTAYELIVSEDPACLAIVDALNQGRTKKGGIYSDPIFMRWAYLIDPEELIRKQRESPKEYVRYITGLELKYLKVDAFNDGTAPLVLKIRADTAGFAGESTLLYEDVDYFEATYWEGRYHYWGGDEGLRRVFGDSKGTRPLAKYEHSGREFQYYKKLPENERRAGAAWQGGGAGFKQINFVTVDGRTLLLIREVDWDSFVVFLFTSRETANDVCYIAPNGTEPSDPRRPFLR